MACKEKWREEGREGGLGKSFYLVGWGGLKSGCSNWSRSGGVTITLSELCISKMTSWGNFIYLLYSI